MNAIVGLLKAVFTCEVYVEEGFTCIYIKHEGRTYPVIIYQGSRNYL